jgi:hypothetical protein
MSLESLLLMSPPFELVIPEGHQATVDFEGSLARRIVMEPDYGEIAFDRFLDFFESHCARAALNHPIQSRQKPLECLIVCDRVKIRTRDSVIRDGGIFPRRLPGRILHVDYGCLIVLLGRIGLLIAKSRILSLQLVVV